MYTLLQVHFFFLEQIQHSKCLRHNSHAGMAKGLTVRVERTANQLSTQATSAFIPPTEGTDSVQVTAAAAAGQVGESGQSIIVQASRSLCSFEFDLIAARLLWWVHRE